MLASLKISQKLGLLVAVAVTAFAVSQGFAIMTERSNSERLNEVRERLYPTLELTTINQGQLQLMEQQISGSVATGDDQQLADTADYRDTMLENLEAIARLNPGLAQDSQRLRQILQTYYRNATQIASSFIDGSADFGRIGEEAAQNAERLEQLRSDLDSMRAQTQDRFRAAITDNLEASRDAGRVAVTILIIALVVLVGLSLVIGRSITASLRQIVRSLKDMASGEGDLTSRIQYSGRDELRELVDQFNLFVEKLHGSFATIKTDVEGLNSAADHLAHSSRTNLNQISDQSQAISSARGSVDDLVRSVEQVAGYAGSASDQTRDAAKFAQSGQDKVQANVSMIRQLASEVESTAGLVNQFDEVSVRVGGLLETIQNVAEQTNLLALNAAIEAARAGEHGRGFAVVADEVRNLAVRTHTATGEIQQVISELSELSSSAVNSMETSVKRAHQGVDATTESGEILTQILQSVKQISELNEQIASATQQQSETFKHLTGRMSDMHKGAEAVMDSTDQLDTISRDIQSVSNGLQRVSSQFRV